MFLIQRQWISIFFALQILSLLQEVNAQTNQKNQTRDGIIKQQQRIKEKEVSKRIDQQQNAPHIHSDEKKLLSGEKFPKEKYCQKINQFDIKLAPETKQDQHILQQFSFLQDIVNNYNHRCVGEKGVTFIAYQLMTALINKGYSTSRIMIPHQDIATHHFVFHLVPGTIGQINFNDVKEPTHWKYAFPFRQGDILNIRDIEQGIEQIKRLNNQDIDIQIVPGDQLGESHIIFISEHAKKNYTFDVSTDNYGEKETGRYLVNSHFSYENLFNRYDNLSLSTSRNVDFWQKQHDLKSYNLNFSMPFGYWTLGLSAFTERTQQNIKGNVTDIKLTNTNYDAGAFVQYLFYRNQVQKDTLEMRASQHLSNARYHIRIHDSDASTEEETDSFTPERKMTRSIILSWQHTHYFKAIQWDLALYHQISQGKNIVLDSPSGKQATFTIQSVDSSIKAPFELNGLYVTFLSTFHGQYASKNLTGDQHIRIGSQYTIRGFDSDNSFHDGALLRAERGMYLRNTLYIPIGKTSHMFYTGVDVGKVFIRQDDELKKQGEHLVGAAIGLQGSYRHADYNVYMGIPISYPEEFGSKRPSLSFSLSYTY